MSAMVPVFTINYLITVSTEGEKNVKSVKKSKKIKLFLIIMVFLLVLFAPLPFPRITSFSRVSAGDGSRQDLSVKLRFIHWRPLFFEDLYGEYVSRAMGYIEIYDPSSGTTVHHVNINTEIRSFQEDTYFIWEPLDHHQRELTSYMARLVCDKEYENIILQLDVWGYDEGPEDGECITYLASKEDLDAEDIWAGFPEYRSLLTAE